MALASGGCVPLPVVVPMLGVAACQAMDVTESESREATYRHLCRTMR